MGEMETKRYILFTLATMVVVVNGYKVTKLFPNVCYDSPDPGPCRAFIPSYFYNPKTNICDCFVYGGCQGNDNRFPDLEQCLETCGDESYQEVITDKCVSLFNVVNPQEEEDVLDQYGSQTHQVPNLCFDPPVTGLCRAYFPHFYFNSETQTCDCFVYGGCGGNDNKFSTLEECLTTCGGQPSQQHNTESCYRILGSQNPLADITLLSQRETQQPQQPTEEETQQSAVATQTLGRENKEEESTGSHGVTSQKFGSSVIRAGSIYVGKPVSIPGFLP